MQLMTIDIYNKSDFDNSIVLRFTLKFVTVDIRDINHI